MKLIFLATTAALALSACAGFDYPFPATDGPVPYVPPVSPYTYVDPLPYVYPQTVYVVREHRADYSGYRPYLNRVY